VAGGPFKAEVAAEVVTETAVQLLKARGEPASLDQLLGDLLIGLDESGQLARLARVLRPAAPTTAGRPGSSLRGWAGPLPVPGAAAVSATAGSAGAGATAGAIAKEELQPSPVHQLLEIIRGEMDRHNNRRIRQVEPGLYWLGSEEDRSGAAPPLTDRVEWAVFSLLSSAGHLTERAAIRADRGHVQEPRRPGRVAHRSLSGQLSRATSTAEAVAGFERLESRTAEHDRVIAMLADVGHRLGMRVWIGRRQQERRVDGRPLGSMLDAAEREIHLPLITWAPRVNSTGWIACGTSVARRRSCSKSNGPRCSASRSWSIMPLPDR